MATIAACHWLARRRSARNANTTANAVSNEAVTFDTSDGARGAVRSTSPIALSSDPTIAPSTAGANE